MQAHEGLTSIGHRRQGRVSIGLGPGFDWPRPGFDRAGARLRLADDDANLGRPRCWACVDGAFQELTQ